MRLDLNKHPAQADMHPKGTLPTKSGDMAIEFAERNRDEELQEILQPRILHTLERELFVSLESQLHALIKQTLLDNNVRETVFTETCLTDKSRSSISRTL